MRLHRFYSKSFTEHSASIELDSLQSTHLSKVLRLAKGDSIEVFNGRGLTGKFEIKDIARNKVKLFLTSNPIQEAKDRNKTSSIIPVLKKDNLHFMVQKLIEHGEIEIAPLAYMRGRTLSRSFIVLDEAQNTTTEQMMMFLTRLGEGSRMVVTGDITQVDLPRSRRSGLKEAMKILKHIPEIQMFFFSNHDVVRHPVVQSIIEAYEKNKTIDLKS